MVYLTVFLLSLASLAYEVLLPRIFSFTQWHHLSFLVVSVVVFGFGAGGLAAGRGPGRWLAQRWPATMGALALLFSLTAAGSLAFLLRTPLDYFRLPLEPRQAGYLALMYLLLLACFLFAGAAQALAFARAPGRAGWLYAAGMAGAACGAAVPMALLGSRTGLGEVQLSLACLALPVLPWVLAPLLRGGAGPAARGRPLALGLGSLTASAALLFLAARSPAQLRPSPYKLLAQARQMAGTRELASENSLRGRVDWLASPALRFAPGLSLAFPGGLPEPELAVVDGDGLLALYPLEPDGSRFSRFSASYAAYELLGGRRGRALLLLESGGLSLACASAAGYAPAELTVWVRHPAVARRLRRRNPSLDVAAGNPRALLARSSGGFEVIQLESWGPSVPGQASLNQDHLLTLEAFTRCLQLLGPDGALTLSRRIDLPPADSLRQLATAFTALKRLGAVEPGRHLAMLRSWDSYTLVVTRRPLGPERLQRLRRFCGERSFDLMFLEGLTEEEANRFNRYDQPYHHRELQALYRALAEGEPERYYRSYYLDVRPASDDRPFPSRFLKPLRVGRLYRATGSRPHSLLLSGEVVVAATLALAVVLGVPLLLLAGRGRPAGDRPQPGWRLYFPATGAAYMFVEMGLIQDFTLLFSDPVTALALALSGLLVFSGLGGALSARWPRRGLWGALGALGCLLALGILFRGRLLDALLRLAEAPRLAVVLLLLAPLGVLLGVPLPVGLRLLASGRHTRAWGSNGIASVLAAVLALPLAMLAGGRLVYLAGACGYLAALAAALPRRGGAVPA